MHRSRRTWVLSTNPLCSRLHRRRVLVLWPWSVQHQRDLDLADWPWRFLTRERGWDAYQVLDGTRPEVVVMIAVDSGSEVHTSPVTFPWNVEQFVNTSICLSDVQDNRLKVYGTALLNCGGHDVRGNVIEIGTRFLVSDTVKFDPCRVCHTKLDVKFPGRARQTPPICQLAWDSTVRYPGRWWRLLRAVQRLHPLDVNWGARCLGSVASSAC